MFNSNGWPELTTFFLLALEILGGSKIDRHPQSRIAESLPTHDPATCSEHRWQRNVEQSASPVASAAEIRAVRVHLDLRLQYGVLDVQRQQHQQRQSGLQRIDQAQERRTRRGRAEQRERGVRQKQVEREKRQRER